MHVTASPKYIFTWNLLFQPKEMSIGISALTVKNVFLKQSCYSNKIWLQLCIFVFQENNKNIVMARQKQMQVVITTMNGKHILTNVSTI